MILIPDLFQHWEFDGKTGTALVPVFRSDRSFMSIDKSFCD
jgi:hypothetical protein